MSSIIRRAGSKLLALLASAADPAAGLMQLYAKLVAGSAELFALESTGVVDQVTGPGAIIPGNYVRGCQLSWVTVARVQVAAGRVRVGHGSGSDDQQSLTLVAPTTADITVAGVNGLDTGVEAANTWYAVYVIGDSTGVNPVATLLSASFSAPTMPAGYDRLRRVGCVRNGAGSNFLRFFQRWNGTARRYWYDESLATLQVLTNGSAIANTIIACASRAPETCRNVVFEIEFLVPTVGGAVGDRLLLNQSFATTVPPFQRLGGTATTSLRWTMEAPIDASQQARYAVSDADDVANIYVLAFDDDI